MPAWTCRSWATASACQLDYYNKTAKGTIPVGKPIPGRQRVHYRRYQPGFDQESRRRVGLNTVNVRTGKFSWTSNINFSIIENRIIDL